MNILNVIQCTNLGGMEQASLRLMVGLKARGHNLTVISLNPLGALEPLLRSEGIPAVGLTYQRSPLRTWLQLLLTVKKLSADCIIQTGHNFFASVALALFRKKPKLLAVHFHHEGVMATWKWRLIYKISYFAFDHLTFPSDYVRHEAIALYPKIADKALTVRNPLPAAVRSSSAAVSHFRHVHGVPITAPLIGSAGWLIPRKRVDIFIRTAAIIAQRLPSARFIVAGDGLERAALQLLARELGIADKVRWLGWLSDLTTFYSAINTLLFTSDWDAYPTSPIEAMNAGLPVVASISHGGLDEVLSQSTGWIFSSHEPHLLSDAVISALGSAGVERANKAKMLISAISDPLEIATQVEALLLRRA